MLKALDVLEGVSARSDDSQEFLQLFYQKLERMQPYVSMLSRAEEMDLRVPNILSYLEDIRKCLQTVDSARSMLERSQIIEEAQPYQSNLTQKQLEIVQLVAQGLKKKDIADRFNIKYGTLKGYMEDIYQILEDSGEIKNSSEDELARWYNSHEIILPKVGKR